MFLKLSGYACRILMLLFPLFYRFVTNIQKHIDIREEHKKWIYHDPVAQSFVCNTVDTSNGIYLKSIELYFFDVDANDEVMVEIRGMTNGYPNSSILYEYAWSKKAGVDIKASVNGSVSTKFEFSFTPFISPQITHLFSVGFVLNCQECK